MAGAETFDSLEKRITGALRALERDWRRVDPSDKECTRKLKNRIGMIGAQLGYRVYADRCRFEHDGEWLFDMTWVEERDGSLFRIPLALECEWGRKSSQLHDDFEKLLAARADHRIFVYWKNVLSKARETSGKLMERVARAAVTRPGDRYLVACWTDESDRFETDLYVAPRAVRRRPRR